MRFGIKSALPIVVGYIPLGLAFGVLAAKAGLEPWEALLMSLLVYSGSGQLVAVGLLELGASVGSIISTVLVINMRYLLFSAALAPKVQNLPRPLLAFLAWEITDESFAVSAAHLDKNLADKSYLLGLYVTAHFSWVSSSLVGATLGNLINNIDSLGVKFALPAMFIALLVMQVKDKTLALIAVAGGLLSLILAPFTGSNVIISTVIAAGLGVGLIKWKKKSSGLSLE